MRLNIKGFLVLLPLSIFSDATFSEDKFYIKSENIISYTEWDGHEFVKIVFELGKGCYFSSLNRKLYDTVIELADSHKIVNGVCIKSDEMDLREEVINMRLIDIEPGS